MLSNKASCLNYCTQENGLLIDVCALAGANCDPTPATVKTACDNFCNLNSGRRRLAANSYLELRQQLHERIKAQVIDAKAADLFKEYLIKLPSLPFAESY